MSNSKIFTGLSLFLILLFHAPYFYFGEDSHILIHDNLDSLLGNMKIILDNDFFASPNQLIPQILNGIPSSSLIGWYSISYIWFNLFGLFYGYLISKVIMSAVGFVGMLLLLSKINREKPLRPSITNGVALIFSLLPFWSINLTVCGLPLVFYAFLTIRKQNKHIFSWLIIIIFPFYSSLVLTGMFLIIILFLTLIIDTFNKRTINYSFFCGIVTFGSLYILSHYPLFYSFVFDSNYISHRTEMVQTEFGLLKSWNRALDLFRYGQYHAHSLHKYILYPIVTVFIFQLLKRNAERKYTLMLSLILAASLIYGFINWQAITLKQKIMNILPLQVDRLHFLNPVFWYVLLALCLSIISKRWKFGPAISISIIILQLGYIVNNHELLTQRNKPTYKQFYGQEQFEEIKNFINKPTDKYRVISIGIHPTIALLNGFYCLDGYVTNYPREYKHQFRKIISGELDKNDKLKKYYDNWGSRCYPYTSEIGLNMLKKAPKKINDLAFNYKAIKQLGGEYILSSAEIDVDKLPIQLQKTFDHPTSYWKIYLYKLE
ncbi:MAG: hypothetical protein JKY53_01620 [Flavobacteriales bacterium]|nr:hypothetical protein [Flavobacteriales bacterium]